MATVLVSTRAMPIDLTWQPAAVTDAPSVTHPVAQTAKIAILDDEPLNVRLIHHQLERLGYGCLLGLSDPTAAMEAFQEFQPDVVLLDVMMPQLSGAELLQSMRQHPLLAATPVIVLTASRDRSTRLKILELGVADFLGKPVDEAELSTRLRNVIEVKRYREHLQDSAAHLELAVRERTKALQASRRDVVLCLARAAEHRDDNTGRHVIRVGRYAAVLARAMAQSEEYVECIEMAAQLHDVGKIGISDAVLHKPGLLSEPEMESMRRHPVLGWRIIAPMVPAETAESTIDELSPNPLQSPMLVMAARIALGHHERWDGGGYPSGLKGTAIPLAARITAVADVFDALSTARCYKPAYTLEKCFEIIAAERGAHFDPQVADACLASRAQFEAVYREYTDGGQIG